MSKVMTDRERADIERRFQRGDPIWRIARELHRCEKTVSRILRDLGHDTKGGRMMTQDEYNQVVERLEGGDHPTDIARDFCRSDNAIYTIRRELDKGIIRDYSVRKMQRVLGDPLSNRKRAEHLSNWYPPPGLKEHLQELRQ